MNHHYLSNMKTMKKIIGFLLLYPYAVIHAQVGITNNGTLQIHSGAAVTGFADFTNTSTAAIINNGSLHLKKDLTNEELAMTVGTGTLILNGTITQSINGTQLFKTYNLETNNTSGITLNNNLSVTNAHTFTAGIVTTSVTPHYMIYQAGATYSGDDDSRHINGWVKKYGSSDFTFPVGNGTYERPVSLTGLTASSEFNVKHIAAIPPDNINFFAPLVLIDSNEYWTINKISGGSARVVLTWDNTKFPIPQVSVSDLRVAYYPGTKWTSIGGSGTGTAAATGTVTSNLTATFNNNFTIGSIAVVLPLQLIEFSGQRSGSGNQIKWVVTNEVNTNEYELQRSTDGLNFTSINKQIVLSKNSVSYYSYLDKGSVNERMFYRLRYIDNNGAVKYSDIIAIDPDRTFNNMFYVVGNPFQNRIAIYAGNEYKGKYNYTLTSNSGQVVQTGVIDIAFAGIQSINLESHIPRGTYILVLHNKNKKLVQKLFKS